MYNPNPYNMNDFSRKQRWSNSLGLTVSMDWGSFTAPVMHAL